MQTAEIMIRLTFLTFFALLGTFFINGGNGPEKSAEPERDQPIIISGDFESSVLKTANGCGTGNYLIPCTGDDGNGYAPILGSIGNGNPYGFTFQDSIPGSEILGVAFTRAGWPENTSLIGIGGSTYPYVVVSDVGMFAYEIPGNFEPWSPPVARINTVNIPNVRRMAKEITKTANDPLALLTRESGGQFRVRIYDYPGLTEQFNFPSPVYPEIFEVSGNDLFITGVDTPGNHYLYHYSVVQDTFYQSYSLGPVQENPREIIVLGDSVFLLSTPGDTMTTVSMVSLSTGNISQVFGLPTSGARATHNEYREFRAFTFQPLADTSAAMLDQQILVFNPENNQLDTLLINLELDYFKQPEEAFRSFGYFDIIWIGARWEVGNDSVFIQQDWDQVKIQTSAKPDFINATYGCWVKIDENELTDIHFEFYPNPASEQVTIHLTGLHKGINYQLDILDTRGKVVHSTAFSAYEKVTLPLQDLPKGLYFLNLDTGKNVISKKLVLQ